jgi:O-acetylhomoserine/O-acetylserine sulfhydrylase-like pyridoxal-dependent enzyme
MSNKERRLKAAKAYFTASGVHAAHGAGRIVGGPVTGFAGSVSSLGGSVHSAARGQMTKAGDQIVDAILSKPLVGGGIAANGAIVQGSRSLYYLGKGTGNLIGVAKDAALMKLNRKHETPEMRTSRRQYNAEKAERAQSKSGSSIQKSKQASKHWTKALLSPQLLEKTF